MMNARVVSSLLLLVSLVVASTLQASSYKRIENGQSVPEFSLQSHDGEVFTQTDLLDAWTLVLVGFTTCPDVCPYTLANLEHVLAETASKVSPDNLPKVVFLAVDPDRDYLSLSAYVKHFHPDFTGVTGDREDIDAFVEGLDAFYELEEPDSTGFYNVRHSADIRVINPDGKLYATIQTPMKAHETSDLLQRMQIEFRRNNL